MFKRVNEKPYVQGQDDTMFKRNRTKVKKTMIYKILHRKLKIEHLIDWVTWMKGFNKTIKLNTSFPQIIVKSHSCHDSVSKNYKRTFI
jgi:hypothetical protein